ncbi:hypothetical protein NKH77_11165 [Streptomyces sp. M19]
MYAFGLLVLLGLAVLVVAKVGQRRLALADELWAFTLVALGVGAAWLTGFDLFRAWGLPERTGAIGITLTGFLIAGAGHFWREVLHFFAGLSRKLTDEAETIERAEQLRRVA